jgi:plasmid stability protein
MTIRNLDDEVKARLRVRAALHGRSMEEEARSILRDALADGTGPATGADLIKAIRARVDPLGGIEVGLPAREPARDPPDFSGADFGSLDPNIKRRR